MDAATTTESGVQAVFARLVHSPARLPCKKKGEQSRFSDGCTNRRKPERQLNLPEDERAFKGR